MVLGLTNAEAKPKPKPKPLSATDKALLTFARECAQKKQAAGDDNIVVDSGRLSRFDKTIWVHFRQQRATPVGDYTLDVTDTKHGCVWLPGE